jgi:hypothetical protein
MFPTSFVEHKFTRISSLYYISVEIESCCDIKEKKSHISQSKQAHSNNNYYYISGRYLYFVKQWYLSWWLERIK